MQLNDYKKYISKSGFQDVWGRVRQLDIWRYLWMRYGIAFLIGLFVVWGVMFFLDGTPRIPRAQWQAVFLNNGQVYFGHLTLKNKHYAVLKNIYYFQTPQSQQGQTPPNPNLVKLGGELHGPEDVMYILQDKILFWENMKTTSQVVHAIESTQK